MGIRNVNCEGQVTAMTSSFRMTDEQVMAECDKYKDRKAVAVFRSEDATVIVGMLYPIENVDIGKHVNPYEKIDRMDGLPSRDDGWPEG